MPFNTKKTTKLNEFLVRVHARLQAQNNSQVLILFEIFVQKNLARDLVENTGAKPELAELDLLAGDFDVIYPFVAEKLHDAASQNFSKVHPDTYQDAHVISEAFCAELNEFFECFGDEQYDLIPIKSFVEMMNVHWQLKS